MNFQRKLCYKENFPFVSNYYVLITTYDVVKIANQNYIPCYGKLRQFSLHEKFRIFHLEHFQWLCFLEYKRIIMCNLFPIEVSSTFNIS